MASYLIQRLLTRLNGYNTLQQSSFATALTQDQIHDLQGLVRNGNAELLVKNSNSEVPTSEHSTKYMATLSTEPSP